ncbi:MAG TPA: hypothetical protein VLI69_02020 [Gammaproteobacteria bacterium]|nr:hypothetical protein [Gammaproteobacteria bacterium]
MFRIAKAKFFQAIVLILICIVQPVLAKKPVHHAAPIHHKTIHANKNHRHINKHFVKNKKHRPAHHAQLRNNVPADKVESTEISSTEPLNHGLAAVNMTNFMHSAFPGTLVNSVKKDLVNFVKKTVDNLHYSSYKLGGKRFDPERGVYIVDCSNFVDHILQSVYPDAYSNLVNSVGADNPATTHYFQFFRDLENESESHWNKINDIEQLQPGDILVFRYKNSRGAETGGHVMVVMDKPERASDVYFVQVADSARSRHSKDTRQMNESGIGIGTLLLKANPKTGQPSAFAWGINSYWNKNVKFAMARPVEIV